MSNTYSDLLTELFKNFVVRHDVGGFNVLGSNFAKELPGVRYTCPTSGALLETGRIPVDNHLVQRVLMYFFRLKNDPEKLLQGLCLEKLLEIWASKALKIIKDLKLEHLLETAYNKKRFRICILEAVTQQAREELWQDVNKKTILDSVDPDGAFYLDILFGGMEAALAKLRHGLLLSGEEYLCLNQIVFDCPALRPEKDYFQKFGHSFSL